MDEELKKAITNLGLTFEEFKKAHDEEVKQLKRGMADAVTTDKLKRIDDALETFTKAKDTIEQKIAAEAKKLEELEKRANRPQQTAEAAARAANELKTFNNHRAAYDDLQRNSSGPVDQDGVTAYAKGLNVWLRKGRDAMGDAEFKAMMVGGDPQGGYLVTPDMSGRMVTKIYESSPLRPYASVQVIGTDSLEGMYDRDEAGTGGWVGETEARPATATPTVGKYAIRVHEQYAMPEATQKLLDDANVDVEAWLSGKVADKMSRYENDAFFNGNGVNKPRGFCSYTTAATADDSRAWGVIEHIATAQNGDFPSSNPGDKLLDVIGALKDAYLSGAIWMTRREVITKIRKFKDQQNAYLWQPGLQAGVPDMLLGYPIKRAQEMPALATGSLSLAFGNFKEGYQIVDRAGFRTLRDPFTNKPYVRFYTTKRVGGDVVQFEAIKFVKFGS